MNKGFVKLIECFYSLFDEIQPISDDEDFKSYHKKDLMAWIENYANMFDIDMSSKPVSIEFENEEDFKVALTKIMKIQKSKDELDYIVEDGPKYILAIAFFDEIHRSLTKRNHSELLPVFKKIKGNFTFQIFSNLTDEVLCTGVGSNGQFTFNITERNIRLPKTLADLHSFGFDLQMLMEISTDFDFIFNYIKINIIE